MKKILIVAGALHIGGAERVAANISKFAPEGEFEFHYLVFEGYENVYGPEIEALGGRVITVPPPHRGYLRYCRRLAELIRENRYVAVHSHTQFNSGLNLAVARLCGVPLRIAHSHTTKTEHRVSLPQRSYEQVMRWLLRRASTHLLACGEEAGKWMFGGKAFSKGGMVIKNGIDTASYVWSETNRESSRRHFGIPAEAFVIGHAGTLLPLKNQEYLIRLLPRVRERINCAVLLLLGAGETSERQRLQALARSLGVEDAVIFAGGVGNVNEVLSAMDVFAFPSLREGTPLALLEAQTNGLPCVVSDRIPPDAFLTELVRPLPLEDEAAWIEAICGAARTDARWAERLAEQGYDCSSALEPLYWIYRSTATVSLSFDDGRGDNTAVLDELLLPAGIPATLNITTGYVDGNCPAELLPSDKAPMSRVEVQRFAEDPLVEIAMHGDFHQNTDEDILNGRGKLLRWLCLPEDRLLGFASPGSGLSLERFRSEQGAALREQVAYLRTSFRITSCRGLRSLSRKVGRVIHLPLLYRVGFHDTVMTDCDGKIVYSIPVMKDATAGQVLSVVRSCVRRRGALVLMLHSILKEVSGEDNWTWERARLETLCRELKKLEQEGKLTLCTTMRQYQLLQNRK